ncbi:MAG: hypothetical protein ACTS53_02085, partial [Candidatus Hodgkinia cicadicola]
NFVPAAAVIRGERALFGFIGRKARVGRRVSRPPRGQTMGLTFRSNYAPSSAQKIKNKKQPNQQQKQNKTKQNNHPTTKQPPMSNEKLPR